MRALLLVAFLLISGAGDVQADASGAAGLCDTFVTRERKAVPYRVGSNKKAPDVFEAKQPCTGATIRVKKCAVIEVRNQKIQRYCFPGGGKPQYAEHFDIIEYWDAPSNR